MLSKIREYFLGEQTDLTVDRAGFPSDDELHLATAVLLLESARADSEVSPQEAQRLCHLLSGAFGIAAEKLPELIRVAMAARDDSAKRGQYFLVLKESYNTTQRKKIYAMVWDLLHADGRLDSFEKTFASQARARLGLSEEDAREAVENLSMNFSKG